MNDAAHTEQARPERCPTCGSDDPALCFKYHDGLRALSDPHAHSTGHCTDPFHDQPAHQPVQENPMIPECPYCGTRTTDLRRPADPFDTRLFGTTREGEKERACPTCKSTDPAICCCERMPEAPHHWTYWNGCPDPFHTAQQPVQETRDRSEGERGQYAEWSNDLLAERLEDFAAALAIGPMEPGTRVQLIEEAARRISTAESVADALRGELERAKAKKGSPDA